jgi:ADP-heptose:LPS heptosyltransferase
MKLLVYHFGYRGDILVVGQNFTRELKARFPDAEIDLMLRPRMSETFDFLRPLGLWREIRLGEKHDYAVAQRDYDRAYMIDERVYPEGNLRTVFTKAGLPFRLHPLTLVTTKEDDDIAARIATRRGRPLIATQADMARKWDENKVRELWGRLEEVGTLLVVGPDCVQPAVGRALTFRESAALVRHADLFVGIDSGISHAAALVGTQTVLIPPVFPESWISPTEYANPFIMEESRKHVSIRPPPELFCGHYFCLHPTRDGGIRRHCGDPRRVRCNWRKRFGFLTKSCCFLQISVDAVFDAVATVLKRRRLP